MHVIPQYRLNLQPLWHVLSQSFGYATVVFLLLVVARFSGDPYWSETLSVSLLCSIAFIVLYLWHWSGIDERIIFVNFCGIN
jgi:hypothetical protein